MILSYNVADKVVFTMGSYSCFSDEFDSWDSGAYNEPKTEMKNIKITEYIFPGGKEERGDAGKLTAEFYFPEIASEPSKELENTIKSLYHSFFTKDTFYFSAQREYGCDDVEEEINNYLKADEKTKKIIDEKIEEKRINNSFHGVILDIKKNPKDKNSVIMTMKLCGYTPMFSSWNMEVIK